jgi:hypothetical protein
LLLVSKIIGSIRLVADKWLVLLFLGLLSDLLCVVIDFTHLSPAILLVDFISMHCGCSLLMAIFDILVPWDLLSDIACRALVLKIMVLIFLLCTIMPWFCAGSLFC